MSDSDLRTSDALARRVCQLLDEGDTAKLVRHKLEPSNPGNSYIVFSTNQMSKYMELQEIILKK
jgi:hypothetical protein